jgi:hypothetical protein
MFLRRNPLKRITLSRQANALVSVMPKAQVSLPRLGINSVFKRNIKIESHFISGSEQEKPLLSEVQQHEQICHLYSKLHDELSKATEQAQKNNKKLLITIGEVVTDKRSLIVQLLMINLMLRNKLSPNLFVVAPQILIDLLRTGKPEAPEKDINLRYLLSVARHDKFDIIPTDPNPSADEQTILQSLKKSILASNQDALVVTALYHLSFVHEDKEIQEKFECLSINAGNISSAELLRVLICSPFASTPILRVLAEGSPYIQANLPSDCLRMDTGKLLKLCEELRTRNPNISPMQAVDEKISPPSFCVRRVG